MAWTKALLRGLFDLDVDGVGKESFRTSFRGRGHWLWVLKVFELAAPHIFTARFLSEMESLVLLAFKLLDKRYQTLIRWTMRSCAYGVVMCNYHLRGSPHTAEARQKREGICGRAYHVGILMSRILSRVNSNILLVFPSFLNFRNQR